jgi:hypothetical protein
MTYESYEIAGKQLKLTAVISRVFKSCIEVPMFKACEDFGETNSGDSNAWICSEGWLLLALDLCQTSFSAPVR